MIFSARTLVTAFVCTTLLSGCFNSSEKQEWQVEPEGEQSNFAVPQKVQSKVDIANVTAEVQVDNEGWVPLTINSGKASGSIPRIPAGVHTISVRFVYNFAGVPIVLTQVVKQVNIIAGGRTRLEILESEYDFDLFDLDQDGVNNADEINLGYDPSNPNSFPVLNVASSSILIPAASSVAMPSSIAAAQSSSVVAAVSSSPIGGGNMQPSSLSIESSSSAVASSSSLPDIKPPPLVSSSAAPVSSVASSVAISSAPMMVSSSSEALPSSISAESSSSVLASSSSLPESSSSLTESSSSSAVGSSSSTTNEPTFIAEADAGLDITDVEEGALVEIQGQAVNPNATVTYSWSYLGEGSLTLSGTDTATLSFQTGEYLADAEFEFELTVTVGDATDTNTVSVFVLADNDAPTFVLPATRTVSPGAVVNLAAVTINDPEGQLLTYTWAPALLNTVVVDDFTADNETATFTAPIVPAGETLELAYELTISDGVNDVTKAIKVIIPSDAVPNAAPVAVITPIAGNSVAEGGTATLDGTGSTDDTTASANLSYAWSLLTATKLDLGITATDLTQSSFSFAAPNLASDLPLEFQLIVTDEQGEPSAPKTYSFTLEGENDAPTATAQASPATAGADTLVTLTASATTVDVDQADIAYTYAWTAPAGYENLLSATTGSRVTFTAPAIANATPLNFSVIATEAITGGLPSAPKVATVTIQEGYFPPVAVAEVAGGGTAIEEGKAATLTAANSQQNTNPITTYLWATECLGALANETQVEATFTPVQALANTNCTFDLTVSDGTAEGVSTTQLAVTITADNDAPVATAPATTLSAIATMPIVLTGITVNDVDTPIADLTYAWTSNNNQALQALSLTTEAQPTFTPPSFAADTPITFTLTVFDGGEAGRSTVQNAVSTAQLSVQVAGNNDIPNPQIVLTDPLDAADISEESTVTLSATAVAGSTSIDRFTTDAELNYTWTPNAALAALGVSPLTGVGLNEYSAQLPAMEAPSTGLAVTLVVEDAQKATSTAKTFTFTADASNEAPELTINGPDTVASNSSVVLQAIATDPEDLRSFTYVWQQIDANGNALAANDPLAVACTQGNTTSQCSFSAPLFNDDQDLSWQVTVTEAGTEDFLLSTTSTKVLTITSGYIAPKLTLSSSTPANEGGTVTITAALTTPGTAAINKYDWSQSTCLNAPVLADFSAVTGDTLTFIAPAQQKADYSCNITLTVTDATNNIIDLTPLALTINAIDDLPVAAIADRALTITGYDPEDVTDEELDGSVTDADEEGDSLIYQWTQDPNDTVQVEWRSRGEDNGIAFFIVEQQATQTQLNFSLTVCDAPNDPLRCDATPAEITITVTATNQAPIAIITVDDAEIVAADADNGSVTVLETEHPAQRPNGETDVIVNVSAAQSSDPAPSNGTLTYSWNLSLDSNFDLGNYANANAWAEGELGLTATDLSAESFSFTTPNFATSQDLVFELTVSDAGGLSVVKELTITVTAENDEPVVTASADVNAAASLAPVQLSSTVIDPDYEHRAYAATVAWSAEPDLIDFGGNEDEANLTINAPNLSDASTDITLTATVSQPDETDGLESSDSFVLTVTQGYFPPVVQITRGNTPLNEGATLSLVAAVSQNTSPIASFTWTLEDNCSDAILTTLTAGDQPAANGSNQAQHATLTLPNRAAAYDCDVTVDVADSQATPGTDTNTLTLTGIAADDEVPQVTITQVSLAPAFNGVVTGQLEATVIDPEGLVADYTWVQTTALGSPVTWLNTSNTGSALDAANGAITAQFEIAQGAINIDLAFELSVTDGNTTTAEQTTTLTVDNNNQAPNAGMNSNLIVDESEYDTETGELTVNQASLEPVDINAPLDDFNPNSELIFAWSLNDDLTKTLLTDQALTLNAPSLNFDVPNVVANNTNLSFTFTVTDGQKLASSSTHTVTIKADNDLPIITQVTTSATTLAAGASASLTVTAFDPESETLSYEWFEVGGSPGAQDDRFGSQNAATTSFTVPATQPQDENIAIAVRVWESSGDGSRSVVNTDVLIRAQSGYIAPTIDLVVSDAPEEDKLVTVNATVTFNVAPNNPTYAWAGDCAGNALTLNDSAVQGPAAGAIGAATLSASFTAPTAIAGYDCNVELTVSDGLDQGDVQQSTGDFTVTANNDAPVVTTDSTVISAVFGMPFNLTATISDDGAALGELLQYNWVAENNPAAQAALTNANTASPTFTPPPYPVDTLVTFTLTVTDGAEASRSSQENAVSTAQVQVNVAGNNQDPVAVISDSNGVTLTGEVPLAETEAGATNASTLVLSATTSTDDYIENGLTYEWAIEIDQIPLADMGLQLTDLTNPTITIAAPNLLADTSFNVSLVVKDAEGNSSATSPPTNITVNITADNDSPGVPTITRNPTGDITGGTEITLTASGADDPEGQSITYTWQEVDAANLPVANGLTCAATTATTCTFNAPDADQVERTLVMQVTASDENKQSTKTESITIAALQTQNLSFENAGPVDLFVGESFINTLNSPSGTGDVSYETLDTPFATVNATTGEVTAISVGQASIVGKIDSDGFFAAASTMYTVNVKSLTPDIIEPAKNEYTLGESVTLELLNPPISGISGKTIIRGWRIIDSDGTIISSQQFDGAAPDCDSLPSYECTLNPQTAGTFSVVAVAYFDVPQSLQDPVATSEPVTITFTAPASSTTFTNIGPVPLVVGDKFVNGATTIPATATVKYSSDNLAAAAVDEVTGEVTAIGVGDAYIEAIIDAEGQYLGSSNKYQVVVSAYTGNTPNVAKLAFNKKAPLVEPTLGWVGGLNNEPPRRGAYFSMQAIGDYLYVIEAPNATSTTRVIRIADFNINPPAVVDVFDGIPNNASGLFSNGKLLIVASTNYVTTNNGFTYSVNSITDSGSLDSVSTFTVASAAPVSHSAFLGDAFFVPSQGGSSQLFVPDSSGSYEAQEVPISGGNAYSSGNYLYVQAVSGNVSRWVFDGAQLTQQSDFDTTARLVGARGSVAYLSDKDSQQLHAVDFSLSRPGISRSLPLHNTSGLVDPTVNAAFYQDSLYLEANGRVTEFDVRVPARPYLKSRFDVNLPVNLGGFQADVFDIAVGAGRIYLGYGPVDGEHYFSSLKLASLTLAANTGSANYVEGNRQYNVSWASSYGVSDVKCQVSAGSCEVTNVNIAASTAKVVWALPKNVEHVDNQHEIIVTAGSDTFMVSSSDRIALSTNTPDSDDLAFQESSLIKNLGEPPFTVSADEIKPQSVVTYRSADPSVAKVGLTSGEVELTGRGQTTITAVGDNGSSASVDITVKAYGGKTYYPYPLPAGEQLFNETVASEIEPRSTLGPLKVVGNGFTAYEYTEDDFVSINVADPSFPGTLARKPLDSRVWTGVLKDSNLFFASASEDASSISIWDATKKNAPENIKTLRFANLGAGLIYSDVSDSYVVWGPDRFNINFIERSAKGESLLTAPYAISSPMASVGYQFYGFKIEGDVLFTGGIGFGETTAIRAYDISNPRQPKIVGEYKNSEALAEGFQADVFYVKNGYVFFKSILNGANAWEIVDFRDPTNPRLAYSSIGKGYAPVSNKGAIVDETGILYMKSFIDLDGELTGVLQQFDLSDPYAPKLIGSYPNIVLNGLDGASGGLLYSNGSIYDLSAKLKIAEELPGAAYGAIKTYFLRWDQPEQAEDNPICRVTDGSCRVIPSSIDLSNNRATVEWTMPASAFGDTVGEHEMYIFVGNENYFISNSVRVDLIP